MANNILKAVSAASIIILAGHSLIVAVIILVALISLVLVRTLQRPLGKQAI